MNAPIFPTRRRQFYQHLQEGEALILFAGSPPRKSADAHYPFFTNRNFFYLTGILQAESVFLAVKTTTGIEETLFVLPKDPMAERWHGYRLATEEAREQSGIEHVENLAHFERHLKGVLDLGEVKALWYDFDRYDVGRLDAPTQQHSSALRSAYPFLSFKNAYPVICAARSVKDAGEIEMIRQAMAITREGIHAMMKAARAGMYEYQLEAVFNKVLADAGVREPAFANIVSGGSGIGGAGVPVFAMDGTTCIARNNEDIYNNWSNPFDGDSILRLAAGSTNLNSDGTEVVASQPVHYSPFLNQFALGDSADVHGSNVWTGGLRNPVNPLGNSIDASDSQQRTRASWGSSNANNGSRTWNRFQSTTNSTLAVYALSEVLTIGTGSPSAPFVLSITVAAEPGTGFDLEWPSKDGKLYRIRSSATMDTAPLTWDIVSEDIASTGEKTTLNVTPGEAKLFYVVEEYNAP